MMKSFKSLRLFLTGGLVLLFMDSLQSQSFSDNALLFSRTRPGGSARIQAMGGTQISLGGDFSSALSNPAGLGMYNRSEFTLSLGLNSSRINSTYFGESTASSNSVFNVPSISLVFHRENDNGGSFLGGTFGISMTRINDFSNEYAYAGTNNQSSIIDYFIEDAYYQAPNDPADMLRGGSAFYSLTALAYNNYLIDGYYDDNNDLQYGSVLSPLPENAPDPGLPAEVRTLRQQESVKRSRGQYQWSFSYGANFADKVFAGASIGVTSLRYTLEQGFTESNLEYDRSPGYNPIDSYNTDETIDIRGTGINLTLGLIFRPVDFIQLGASFVTPTSYSLTDNYDARVESHWNNFDYDDDPSTSQLNDVYEQFDGPSILEYSLTTPLKFSAGATFISKFGLLTGDVEVVNYSNAKYKSDVDGIAFTSDNEDIKAAYSAVVNYRFGAEFRYEIYRVRGGFNVMADPYLNSDIDRSINSISGGLGIKKDNFFIDLAVIHRTTEGSRTPYSVTDFPDPVVRQAIKATSVMITTGFTF